MFILNKISFHFLLSSEAFSNNRELLSTIDKMSWKLHGQLTRMSKFVDNKIQIMKAIKQKAVAINVSIAFWLLTFYQMRFFEL